MTADAQLVERCLAGDQAAWNELVEIYSRYVYAIVSKGFRLQGADAEDAFQEVFLRIYDRLGTLRNPEALRPWIAQLTRRVCLDRLAASGREEPAEVEATETERTVEELDDAFSVREALGRAVGGVPGGARPLLLPRRELPDDRRRAGDPVRHDREPDLALPGEAEGEVRVSTTLLFTDVEGSTKLLHELGDGYAAVLAEHRRVLREAFGAHGGAEVDTQGERDEPRPTHPLLHVCDLPPPAIAAWAAAKRSDAERAGILWGTIEAQERRAPSGSWENERPLYAARLERVAGPEFDQARAEGTRLSLDEAVEYALAGRNEPSALSGGVRP